MTALLIENATGIFTGQSGAAMRTAGSIRVPAHFCGICGLKPTPGRIAATGHFPPGDGAFSWIGVVGPMGRTVADVRALFEVIVGPDPGDALSAPVPVQTIEAKELRGLRIGILESDALGPATEETKDAVQRAAKLLGDSQFVLEPMQLDGLEQVLELWWFFFGPVIGDLLRKSVAGREEQLSPIFQEYLSVSIPEKPVTLDAFLKGCAERDLVRGQILRQMRDVPVLLSPVCSAPAFRHGEGNWKPGTGYQETMRYSQWLNLTGFPGISVPMRRSSEGLPIGVQLIGRHRRCDRRGGHRGARGGGGSFGAEPRGLGGAGSLGLLFQLGVGDGVAFKVLTVPGGKYSDGTKAPTLRDGRTTWMPIFFRSRLNSNSRPRSAFAT